MVQMRDIPFAIPILNPIAVPIAIPVGSIHVENGFAKINSKIRCYYKLKPDLPGKWYYGVITHINSETNHCNILYEAAGFSITGGGKNVYLVGN